MLEMRAQSYNFISNYLYYIILFCKDLAAVQVCL